MRASKGSAVVLLLAAAIAAALAFHDDGRRARASRPVLVRRPVDLVTILPGDPRAGERAYRIHCVSCHGWKGDGRGPFADAVFPPRARDHTDGAYMNLRTDEELFAAIRSGGREVSRSKIMPSFQDSLDETETWNLVAYIRTLHPRIEDVFPQFGERKYHEVVLSRERAGKIEREIGRPLAPSERPVYLYALYDSTGALMSYVLFSWAELKGVRIALTAAFSEENRLIQARTHRRVEIPGAEPSSVDVELGKLRGMGAQEMARQEGPLAEAIRLALLRFVQAREQLEEDRLTAKGLLEVFDARPRTLPMGQRIFLESCMVCHGPLGRPTAYNRDYKPRNLADPNYMSNLTDGYIRGVIRYGGIAYNISPSMPSHNSMSADQLDALAAFVRSLSSGQ